MPDITTAVDEVVMVNMLSYLAIKDLLLFQQVSKYSRFLAKNSLRQHKTLTFGTKHGDHLEKLIDPIIIEKIRKVISECIMLRKLSFFPEYLCMPLVLAVIPCREQLKKLPQKTALISAVGSYMNMLRLNNLTTNVILGDAKFWDLNQAVLTTSNTNSKFLKSVTTLEVLTLRLAHHEDDAKWLLDTDQSMLKSISLQIDAYSVNKHFFDTLTEFCHRYNASDLSIKLILDCKNGLIESDMHMLENFMAQFPQASLCIFSRTHFYALQNYFLEKLVSKCQKLSLYIQECENNFFPYLQWNNVESLYIKGCRRIVGNLKKCWPRKMRHLHWVDSNDRLSGVALQELLENLASGTSIRKLFVSVKDRSLFTWQYNRSLTNLQKLKILEVRFLNTILTEHNQNDILKKIGEQLPSVSISIRDGNFMKQDPPKTCFDFIEEHDFYFRDPVFLPCC